MYLKHTKAHKMRGRYKKSKQCRDCYWCKYFYEDNEYVCMNYEDRDLLGTVVSPHGQPLKKDCFKPKEEKIKEKEEKKT